MMTRMTLMTDDSHDNGYGEGEVVKMVLWCGQSKARPFGYEA